MKKIILSALVAVCTLSASAQTWIGGEVGFNSSTTKIGGVKTTATTFTVAPEVGYTLNDKFDVAVKVAYGHASHNDEILGAQLGDFERANAIEVNPYVRYTFARTGALSFFIDGGLTYATAHVKGLDENANAFGVAFNPGLAYGLSDKVSLVAHIGDASYSHTKWGAIKNDQFNLGLTNAITFGVYFGL
ncbi:MAG: porin family protein [Bacteroidaceae bacterium]|nr:porin family protein [Bacteroidaceae bacterium]